MQSHALLIYREMWLDFAWLRHQHFSCHWPFVRGLHRPPVDSPHKDQWRGALMFSFMCAWTNGWANSEDVGDLRRQSAHCYVTVIESLLLMMTSWHGNAHKGPPVMRSVNVCVSMHKLLKNSRFAGDLRCHGALNPLLNKQSNCRWFETPWHSYEAAIMQVKRISVINHYHWFHGTSGNKRSNDPWPYQRTMFLLCSRLFSLIYSCIITIL